MAFKLSPTGYKNALSKYGRVSTSRGVSGLKSGSAFGNFQVLGVPAAIAKFRLAGSIAGRESGLIAMRGAQRVKAEAKKNVHSKSNRYDPEYIYTDNLKDSIEAVKTNLYSWQVVAGAEYAAYEELGTSKNPAHPFLRPALYAEVPKAQAELHVLARKLEQL